MAASTRQRLTVRAGDTTLWIDASSIVEVVRAPRLTRTPHGPPSLLGLAQHRGGVLPVISTSELLGVAGARPERVVVLGRGAPIGLAVDAVGELESTALLGKPEGARRVLENQDGTSRLDLDEALLAHFEPFSLTGRQAARRDAARPVRATRTQSAARSFLSFWVSGQIYAVPLEDVREVADAERILSASGAARDTLEFRGSVLPVIVLGDRLGLAAGATAKRLIIVGVGARALAMLVDQIGAVIRLDDARVGKAPSLFNRRDDQAVIASVLRMPDGKGVVSVLSVDSLIGDGFTQSTVAADHPHGSASADAHSSGLRSRRALVVGSGSELRGLPMQIVREVIRRPDRLARPPRSPSKLQGVINLRGRVIPVIRDWAGPSVSDEPAYIVVASISESWLGLLTDRVVGAVDAPWETAMLERPRGGADSLFQGVIGHEGMTVPLIDPDALRRSAETDLASHTDRGKASH
jgi:purine-binding chemotaxis protein CheW